MRKLTLLWVLVACLLCGHAQCAAKSGKTSAKKKPAPKAIMPQGEWDARIVTVSGKVLVRSGGDTLWVRVKKNFPLEPGDSVRTMEGALAEITLDGKVYLSVLDNSIITLDSLDYTGAEITIENGYVVGRTGKETGLKNPLVFSAETMQTRLVNTGFALMFDRASKETTATCFGPGEISLDRVLEDGQAVRGVKIVQGRELTYTPETKFLIATNVTALGKYRALAQGLNAKAAKTGGRWVRMDYRDKADIRDEVFSRAEDSYVRRDRDRYSRDDYYDDYDRERPVRSSKTRVPNRKSERDEYDDAEYDAGPRPRMTDYEDGQTHRRKDSSHGWNDQSDYR